MCVMVASAVATSTVGNAVSHRNSQLHLKIFHVRTRLLKLSHINATFKSGLSATESSHPLEGLGKGGRAGGGGMRVRIVQYKPSQAASSTWLVQYDRVKTIFTLDLLNMK